MGEEALSHIETNVNKKYDASDRGRRKYLVADICCRNCRRLITKGKPRPGSLYRARPTRVKKAFQVSGERRLRRLRVREKTTGETADGAEKATP